MQGQRPRRQATEEEVYARRVKQRQQRVEQREVATKKSKFKFEVNKKTVAMCVLFIILAYLIGNLYTYYTGG